MKKVQHLTGIIEDTLFHVEPELARQYAHYLAVSALPAPSAAQVTAVAFRIVYSDYLHIEVFENAPINRIAAASRLLENGPFPRNR